jgi:hypothetical protein
MRYSEKLPNPTRRALTRMGRGGERLSQPDVRYWLDRAEQACLIASEIRHLKARRVLLALADEYLEKATRAKVLAEATRRKSPRRQTTK